MIVKDQKLTIAKANELSAKLIQVFADEAEKFCDEGDPAEQIYLAAYTLGQLTGKFSIAMDGYNKIYNIPDFNGSVFRSWIDSIEKEFLKINKGLSHDISEHVKTEESNKKKNA